MRENQEFVPNFSKLVKSKEIDAIQLETLGHVPTELIPTDTETSEILEKFAIECDRSMYIIDIALKNTPSMLSVQRKTAEDAEALYQEISGALKEGRQTFLELTCDKQPDKKVGVLVSEISAVQVSEKSGPGTTSGRPPGFFALNPEPTTSS